MNDFTLSAADAAEMNNLLSDCERFTNSFLGYPVAKDFDYSPLFPFLQYPLNNLGDPYISSTYAVGSREMEKYVISFFADLFRAEPDNYWGYVTNGGSEGNLYGLYLAREIYPKGMVYYSESTHYSVQKNIHLLNLPGIIIKSQENGEMDYEDLEEAIRPNRHLPVIILANIGTTMTEARDNVSEIKAILRKLAIRHHYIHADGALSGSYAAFLDPRPAFDFADGVDSIAISGHKFIGSPIPCGVVLAKKTHRDRIARSVAYIGTLDTTITGSRNGHSPLFLWYALKSMGVAGLKMRAENSLATAAYAVERLNEMGIAAWRNCNAITVVFPAPSVQCCRQFQLAAENGISHIICMPGIGKRQIDQFVTALQQEAAVPA
jgi:histidine decarboxylase